MTLVQASDDVSVATVPADGLCGGDEGRGEDGGGERARGGFKAVEEMEVVMGGGHGGEGLGGGGGRGGGDDGGRGGGVDGNEEKEQAADDEEKTALEDAVRRSKYASKAATEMFLPLMFSPEPTFGFSSRHHQLLMWNVTKRVWDAGIHSFGDTTDSCSTGISAGAEIMTPTNAKMPLFQAWLGLDGVPGFRYWSPLVACGMPGTPAASLGTIAPCSNTTFHENRFIWYGDTTLIARNLRKGWFKNLEPG